LKNIPSRIAVSPMTPLSSFRIAVIRLGGTPIAFASAFAVRPSGFAVLAAGSDERNLSIQRKKNA
jgi:hypothetical protein